MEEASVVWGESWLKYVWKNPYGRASGSAQQQFAPIGLFPEQ